MKKIIIQLSILILCINSAFSQISKIYTYESVGNKIDCNIFFYKEGIYKLTLDDYTNENPYQVILSKGNYVVKSDTISLTDQYNKFNMQFLNSGKYIVGIKAFQCFENKKFKESYLDIYDKPIILDSNNLSLKDSRVYFAEKNNELFNFSCGTYLMQLDFTLNLYAEYSFKFCYRDVILLKGSWKRNQNEIVLNDNLFKHPFYVIIDKDKLRSKILPDGFNNEMHKIE
jgi:hypothetical protein